ncbi:MAG: peptidylprolyl isomerase [Nanoarchaeota archaeon]
MAKKTRSEGKAADADEFSFDVSSILGWFKGGGRMASVLLVLLLLIIPMGISVYYRSFTYDLPITEEWAQSTVFNYYRDGVIRPAVNAQYPNLPPAKKDEIVQQEFDKFYVEQKATIDATVTLTSQSFRERLQDDRNQTYLPDIDSYFYYRYARNVAETGHMYDELRAGVPYDDHMAAPLGLPAESNLHPFFSGYFHRFLKLFKPDITVMESFFFVPILLATLSIIPAFFIVRRKAGNVGGFIAALILAIHPTFLSRTAGGYGDTDVYTALFPLLIVWAFIEAFEAKTIVKQSILAVVAGFLIGMFSWVWLGWWFIFLFILAVIAAYAWFLLAQDIIAKLEAKRVLTLGRLLNRLVYFALAVILFPLVFLYLFYLLYRWFGQGKTSDARAEIMQVIQVGLIIVLASAVFVSVFSSFHQFVSALGNPVRIYNIKDPAKIDLFPNVYTTVAELNPLSITGAVDSISNFSGLGGFAGKYHLFFIIAVLGVVGTMAKSRLDKRDALLLSVALIVYFMLATPKMLAQPVLVYFGIFALPILLGLYLLLMERKFDIKYALFLIVWFSSTMFASTRGTRFLLLLVPGFAIAVGMFFGLLYRHLSVYLVEKAQLNRVLVGAGIIIMILLLFIGSFKVTNATARSSVPMVDDAWWDSLTYIKDNSAPDAIVNSWWDFGHWFKAIADRQVTFDGASQNSPPAHWIGKVLVTDDEAKAVGLLRMLDCGSHNAFLKMEPKFETTVPVQRIVNEIVLVDGGEAKTILMDNGFTSAEADGIIRYTHCDPPEDYFITSEDMTGKAGVWAHFGLWDFGRAYVYLRSRAAYDVAVSDVVRTLDVTEEEAVRLLGEVQSQPDDVSVNAWISPWPRYVTPRWVGCQNISATQFNCTLNLGVGQSGNVAVVIENLFVDTQDMDSAYLTLSQVQTGTNQRISSERHKPYGVVITGEDRLVRTAYTEDVLGGFNVDILVDTLNNRALLADPSLIMSTYTKLFYLDGRYMPHFDKVREESTITGSRIVIWKVDWDGKSGAEYDAWISRFGGAPASVDEVSDMVDDSLDVSSDATPVDSAVSADSSAVDASLKPRAVMETTKGKIVFELEPKDAPITVENFIGLVDGKFYDGLTFHRVEPGFVIQTGDPKGEGTGGSDKTIPLEISPNLKHRYGAVGMARSLDPDSASSQFYIAIGDASFLDGNYAVFGYVIDGMDVAESIEVGDRIISLRVE